ncbi:hypothetical protein [Nonomuraea fuscirosea]
MADGTAGGPAAAPAAEELWAARAAANDSLAEAGDPGPLFAALSARVSAIYEAERAAIDRLSALTA